MLKPTENNKAPKIIRLFEFDEYIKPPYDAEWSDNAVGVYKVTRIDFEDSSSRGDTLTLMTSSPCGYDGLHGVKASCLAHGPEMAKCVRAF